MKYLFIITGIAYGHLTREEAIISKLKQLDKKADITVAGFGTSYDYFKNKYKMLKLEPRFFPDSSNKIKFFETLSKNYKIVGRWIINNHSINKFVRENKINVVVSDWEPFTILLKKCDYLIWNYKSKYAKVNNFISLIEKIVIGLGYLIAGILGKKIILPTLKKEKNTRNFIYTNLIIRKIPDETKGLEKYKNSILVMIGGAKFGYNLSEKIDNLSKELNERFIFFNYKSKNCINYNKFKDDYLSYLKSCKAVISLGGYSGISESIFFKKPNLAFPIKNWIEQQAVVEEFKDYIEIGNIDASEEELKLKIKGFLTNLNKIKKKLNTLKLNNGAYEIAKIVYEKANS